MTEIVKPLAEVNRQALRLLYRELGVANAVRFLKQFTPGLGNYTQERDTLLADKSLKEIVSELETLQEPSTDNP